MTDKSPSAGGAEPTPAASSSKRHWPLIGTRRKFLVNSRYQLRVTAMVTGAVLVCLVMLNLVLYNINRESTDRLRYVVPQLHGYIEEHHRVELTRLIVGSLIFLAAVALIAILESHRTAGAAVAIEKNLRKMAQGDLTARVRLRKTDNLKELERAFNHLADSLGARTRAEIEDLVALAQQAEGQQISTLAAELRRLAEEKRKLVQSS